MHANATLQLDDRPDGQLHRRRLNAGPGRWPSRVRAWQREPANTAAAKPDEKGDTRGRWAAPVNSNRDTPESTGANLTPNVRAERPGTAGTFAATFIERDLRAADEAAMAGDVVQMLRSLQTLRGIKD